MTPTDVFNHLRGILTVAQSGRLTIVKGGAAELAHWFGHSLGGGTTPQYEELCALAGTPPASWTNTVKRVSVEPRTAAPQELHQHDRVPPGPVAAGIRLCTIMLNDIRTRLDDGVSPEVLLSDVDALRVIVAHHGLVTFTKDVNDLYAQCEPVPEPTFTSWNREYRANIGKPWETVVTYPNHAEAHRGLLKAQAQCPGLHRIIGVVA